MVSQGPLEELWLFNVTASKLVNARCAHTRGCSSRKHLLRPTLLRQFWEEVGAHFSALSTRKIS
jgi:hypothetical protein